MNFADPMIEALWGRVLADFENEGVHAAFLAACRERGRLAEAAARYRGEVESEARREFAEKQLEVIVGLAMSQLTVSVRKTTVQRNRHLWGLIMVALLGVALCLVYILH